MISIKMKGSFFFYLVFIFFLVNVVAKSNSQNTITR